MTGRVAGCCRDDGISLDTKAVLAGAFVFLFRVNRETAAGRRFIWQTNRACRGHKTTIAFHHVNVFLRQGNEHTHFGRLIWLVRSHVVRASGAHVPSCRTTGKH